MFALIADEDREKNLFTMSTTQVMAGETMDGRMRLSAHVKQVEQLGMRYQVLRLDEATYRMLEQFKREYGSKPVAAWLRTIVTEAVESELKEKQDSTKSA